MDHKRELAVLEFIAAAFVSFTASWPEVRQFLSGVFPYADVAIPAVAFVLSFQVVYFIWARWLWKYHPDTTYLGGQWIYKTRNVKKIDVDPVPLDNPSQYGVFELIHTIDKILIHNGKAWDCGESPSSENIKAIWKADAVVYWDENLWIIANVIGDEPPRSHQTQLATLTVGRGGSQIEMTGKIEGVADPDAEYAYGFTEIKKISNRPQEDAAKVAYRIFGSL